MQNPCIISRHLLSIYSNFIYQSGLASSNILTQWPYILPKEMSFSSLVTWMHLYYTCALCVQLFQLSACTVTVVFLVISIVVCYFLWRDQTRKAWLILIPLPITFLQSVLFTSQSLEMYDTVHVITVENKLGSWCTSNAYVSL